MYGFPLVIQIQTQSLCNGDCTVASCGDGQTNGTAGEQCDDGGESLTCNANCTTASCGDGVGNTTAGEECDTGAARLVIGGAAAVEIEGVARCESLLRLRDAAGRLHEGRIARVEVEVPGPLCATVRVDGEPIEADGRTLVWSARLELHAGKSWFRVSTTLHHPGAAAHPGGCWSRSRIAT